MAPSLTIWRLLDHGSGSPRWNMAVDRALWRSHAEAGGPPTLRFYQWSQPTLSLGAAQKLPRRLSPDRLQALGLAVVRRPTGGRAVLHGGDLTYAVVAGEQEGFPRSVTLVYQRLCRVLQAGLARLGLEVLPGAPRNLNNNAVNCFAGVAGGDLSWQGKKLVGSAQVWQGGTFLQHGAILLNSQAETWRLLLASDRDGSLLMTSLAEILGLPPSLSELKTALLQGFQEELGLSFESGGLTSWEEQCLAVELKDSSQRITDPLTASRNSVI
jgi:lipoyl(octanoyl) transferase